MNIVLGILIGLAIGIAAVQLGAVVVGPLVDIVLGIVAAALLVAALAAGLIYVFRHAILRSLRLKADARVEDLRRPATAIVEALDQRELAAAASASIELATVILAWQSQIRARQAIVAGLSALLALFAAVLGSSLLVRQNELIKGQTDLMKKQGLVQRTLLEQQNRLISEQTYSMRAQTTAALLAGSRGNTFSSSDAALLAAFGEIGFDSLELLAREGDANGAAVRAALVAVAPRLGSDQAIRAFKVLIRADAETRLDTLKRNATELDTIAKRKYGFYREAVDPTMRIDLYFAPSRLKDVQRVYVNYLLVKAAADRRSIEFAKQRRGKLESDFEATKPFEKSEVMLAVADFYTSRALTSETLEVQDSELRAADEMMSLMCHGQTDQAIPLSSQLHLDIDRFRNSAQYITLERVVFVSAYRWCLGGNPPVSTDAYKYEETMYILSGLSVFHGPTRRRLRPK
jgi:hypothetical protein